MAKRLKRAFTIVELVIVIAVIAILAAVLIPTFTTLIDKANQSNDTVTVKNLNTAITATEATEEINTMQDALDAAQEYGYTVDKLTPTSSGDIVWDEVSKRFALLDSDGKVVYAAGELSSGASLWKIAKDGELSTKYSNYLSGEWSGPIETSLGVDVGSNEGLDIQYTNTSAQTVTFRTNGGTLTIEAPNDTVNHYGTAVKVIVTAVASNSYHEYGEVLGNIELTKGRVVVEEGASASTILVKAGSAADIKIEVNSNATVGTVAATAAGVITAENTTVPSTTDKVTEAVIANTDFAGGIGTEKSPYLIETSEQFRNIGKLYAGKTGVGVTYTGDTYFFKQVADIVMPAYSGGNTFLFAFTGTYDGGNFTISFAEDCVVKDYAYLIGYVFNQTTIKNLTIELNENQPISMIYSSDWKTDKLTLLMENVTVDSNGKTVKANSTNFGFFGSFTNENFTSITYKNCVNNANLINEGTSTGAFLGSGYIFYEGEEGKVEYINCVNNGDITGANQTGILYGNGAYVGVCDHATGPIAGISDYEDGRFVIENFTNSGTILSLLDSGKAAFAPGSIKISSVSYTQKGSYVVGGYFSDKNVHVNQNGNSYQVNLQDETVSFKIAFNINRLDNPNSDTFSNTTKYFYDITSNTGITSTNVLTHKAYDKQKAIEVFGEETVNGLTYNEDGIAMYVDGNTMYFIFRDKEIGRNGNYNTPGETSIVVYVYAYNANGECVGVKTVK